MEAGRLDGPRPQQVRRPSPLRASPEDEATRSSSRSIAKPGRPTTRPSTSRRWRAAMARSRPRPGRAGALHDHVQDHVRGRGRPSAGRRRGAHEVSPRPPSRYADRTDRRVPLQGGQGFLAQAEDLHPAHAAGHRDRPQGQERPEAPGIHDLALQPVVDEDMDKLSLFAETAGGGAAVNKRRARTSPAPRSRRSRTSSAWPPRSSSLRNLAARPSGRQSLLS